jgi:CheY-like chemotaxis protein
LSGVRLIKKLKKARPDLPIVAVTASNKAWTSKTLRSAGADGYWIKESPEYGVRTGYTIQNAADLITTLHETLQRYDNAAPIWALVRRIHQLKASRDRLEPFVSLTTEKDPYGEVENRLSAVEQRLRRAFGYLVMKTSDHAEEEFAFNRLDLAFLTVWSVLNEVAALYFSDPEYQGRDLNKTNRKHEFRFLDPKDQSVTVYWEIENGQVEDASPSIPSSLEPLLRPTTNEGKPQWPGRNKDNPRIQWLLHRAGASGLARRMHDDDFKKSQYDVKSSQRPPLRNLRNNLEEAHGEVQEVWHARLRDVHDMVNIWNAILPV